MNYQSNRSVVELRISVTFVNGCPDSNEYRSNEYELIDARNGDVYERDDLVDFYRRYRL